MNELSWPSKVEHNNRGVYDSVELCYTCLQYIRSVNIVNNTLK